VPSILSKISKTHKLWLKAKLAAGRVAVVRAFRSYDEARLLRALRAAGVRSGDSVMLHGSFAREHGFKGSIEQLTNVFMDAVGPSGNLLMVSLPYRTSSIDYLERFKQFDVRRTPSMMGLVSEFFRRRPDVIRSVHPTHPILAWGPDAKWFVEDHADCLYPCGPNTPFDRLAEVEGLVVFYNAPFGTFTFFHYLEHLVSTEVPFPVYTEAPFVVSVLDDRGEPRTVNTYAYSREAIRRRRPEVLENALRASGLLIERKVGNTRLLAVRVRDAIDCVKRLSRQGTYFYDLSEHA
jgi:aminoglycoside 3-N-acetyltransferase